MKPETREKLLALVRWFRLARSPAPSPEQVRAAKLAMLREAKRWQTGDPRTALGTRRKGGR